MNTYELSADARDDLGEIFEYISRDSLAGANRTIRAIAKGFRLLADFPGAGPSREDLGPGIRTLPVEAYVIIYRQVPDGVQVVRVLHGARNIKGPL